MPYHVSTFSSLNSPNFSSEILSGHVLLLLCVLLAAIVTMIFFIRKFIAKERLNQLIVLRRAHLLSEKLSECHAQSGYCRVNSNPKIIV